MQIQPYNDRIQLSLSTIAFTDNKERAAGMNLKEVYEIFYPGKCENSHPFGRFLPNIVRKKSFLKNFFR